MRRATWTYRFPGKNVSHSLDTNATSSQRPKGGHTGVNLRQLRAAPRGIAAFYADLLLLMLAEGEIIRHK